VSAGSRRIWSWLTAPALFAAGTLEADSEHIAAELEAAEFGNRRSGFMAFHADVTEAAAFAAEHIDDQFDGMHSAKFGEQSSDCSFGRVARQVADKYSFQNVS